MIKIEIKGLDKLKRAFREAPREVADQIQKAINQSVVLVQANARKEAPHKTGTLQRGIKFKVSPFKGRVESTTDYGIYVHEGTKAHIIRPVRKKALFWKGASHPVKMVHHPGTKANPFMTKGASRSEGQVQRVFQIAVNKALSNITK